jgi:starch phosphorylase
LQKRKKSCAGKRREKGLFMTEIKEIIPNDFHLPKRISRLGEFAYNLWWVWNPEVQRVFSWIQPTLWERVNHNPVLFLKKVSPERLQAATQQEEYLQHYDQAMMAFDRYMAAKQTWSATECSELNQGLVAYFSFEFGLHESVPVYAGGLGVLSGDHLKEASDLGLPLVGVGFIYQQGYFTQTITEDGWQETRNYFLNFEEMPIIPLLDADNKPVKVSVMLVDHQVSARLWKMQVGRISLYLLDSNLEENTPGDRQLTARLYSNDLEVRISQEILLGIGGVRALRRLGYEPNVWHMNEGHSAFLGLERVREMIEQRGLKFAEAAKEVRTSNVFTTHTPVPAGNDQFPIWLVEKFFSHYWTELGLTRDEFIGLARHAQPWGETFSMPVLALRLSEHANGVSKLHGKVSRKMWNFLWPELEEDKVPISHITNGVHNGSWLARRTRVLFDEYLGADWMEHLDDTAMWEKVLDIPDEELWAARRHLKRKLVMFANRRVRRQWLSTTVHPVQVVAGGAMLEPYSLTIGFARRFATYKRGYLIFRDFDRLLRIINDENRPVQILFAGKAHPADEPGKMLIQQVYRAVKDAKTGGRLVFLDDYDMNVARYLVQGVDVWLNTPRRPNEASGTSGMKAAMNGVLNFSILDGWWYEGYNGHNGWAIGDGTEYADHNQQDDADAASLYDVLENQIIPLYYNGRPGDSMSHGWMEMVKESIRTLSPQFSMTRMVKEYALDFYRPAAGKKH